MLAAQDLIVAALNRGDITAGEARELQDVVAQAWQARKEAEGAPADLRERYDPQEAKRLVVEAATGLGMVWPQGMEPLHAGCAASGAAPMRQPT
jgi:hypothetical protein